MLGGTIVHKGAREVKDAPYPAGNVERTHRRAYGRGCLSVHTKSEHMDMMKGGATKKRLKFLA